MKKINIWYLSSFLISFVVLIPIATVSFSFFEETTEYYKILKETFLIEYIYNSATLLVGVLILTFIFGTGAAYLVSFYDFPGSNFFKWALILSFAVPPYIYAYSIFAFFDNYGTAFTILKNLFPLLLSQTSSANFLMTVFNFLLNFFENQLLFYYSFKSIYLILSVLFALFFYIFICYFIKAFKISDIKLNY